VHTGFGGRHEKNLAVGGRIIIKWIFRHWVREAWSGLLLLRTGTGGGVLLMG
jgi:hypothetical protein